jgi:hypothetical protein
LELQALLRVFGLDGAPYCDPNGTSLAH